MCMSYKMAAVSPPSSIAPLGISPVVHPPGKHIGKEIWGSVVQPGQADTSPKHHAQLSSKPKDSSGRLSYRTPSCLLRKCTGLAQSWGTTFKGQR